MSFVTWDKNGKIIHQSDDDSQYQMWAIDLSTYGIAMYSGNFPENGKILDTQGQYRDLSDAEKIKAGMLTVFATQKIVDGSIVNKTLQEQVNDGTITLVSYQTQAINRITSEAYNFLSIGKTPENGYATDDFAQKIVIATFAMNLIPDSDPDKKSMLASGLLYPIEQAREIVSYMASVMAARNAAVADIKKAANIAAVDAIKLFKYL